MTLVSDILERLCAFAPVETAAEWDNCGLLCGRYAAEVRRILVTLDITGAVIEKARERGCELIVSHHPLYFAPPRRINDADPTAEKILTLAEHRIGAICMHTCLDAAAGGVNDVLAEKLGLGQVRPLDPAEELGRMGRIGALPEPLETDAFCERVKHALQIGAVKLADSKKPIRTVAVLGGAGGDALEMAKAAGADALVTGDVKHHVFLAAAEAGVTLLDAGHFHTENPVCAALAARLSEWFPGCEVLLAGAENGVISTK